MCSATVEGEVKTRYEKTEYWHCSNINIHLMMDILKIVGFLIFAFTFTCFCNGDVVFTFRCR